MPFGRKNYMIMLLGIGVILLGFIVMSIDNEEFGFGFLGITLGPILLLLGLGIQFWAIFFYDHTVNDIGEAIAAETQPAVTTKASNKIGKKDKKR